MTIDELKELKPRIERLNELRAQIAEIEGRDMLSDADFSRRFLPFSSTTWSKLQSGTYGGGFETISQRLDDAIADVEGRLPNLESAAATRRTFRRTTLARAVLAALSAAREGLDDRRVVVVLAPTGGGKTAIRDYLASRNAVCVEGRQAWRNSYRAFCLDVARAAGRKLPSTMAEFRIEEEMLAALRAKPRVLYIDEANTMSAQCANAIKLIVNETECCVVIAAIPELWDRFLAGSVQEAAQLVNRCQPILRAPKISAADAKLFLSPKALSVSGAAQKVAAAANAFGGYRTVLAIDAALSECDAPGEDDLDAALARQRNNLAAAGLGAMKTEY